MRLQIPMAFSKATKRKSVFATDDGLAPTSNVYMLTEFLRLAGAEMSGIVATLSDVPFTVDETRRMLTTIQMTYSRGTKYKTVFNAVDESAPVDSIYVISEWLRSHDFGDVLYLGVSDAASFHESEGEKDRVASANGVENLSADDAFEAFLAATVGGRNGDLLTTAQIRTPWAARHGADPDDEVIGGIHKNTVARRFRKHFGAPPGKRGRVNGKIEYYWEGFRVIDGEEA